MSSATKKVAYNTIIQIIGRGVITVISLAILWYLARYLGVEGYGQYALIFAYLALFGVLVDFGLFLMQVRAITRQPAKESYILGNILGLKMVLSVVVFAMAIGISHLLYDNPLLATGILIGAISQTTLTLSLVPISLFQARLQMQKVTIINIATRILYFGLIVWGIRADIGLLGIIGIMAFSNLLNFAAQWMWASSLSKLIPLFDFKYWIFFMREALPVGVVIILGVIYFRIDMIMLGTMQGDYAVGIYGAPYKVVEVILTIPTIFMSSVFPVITKALADGATRVQRIHRKAFDFMSLVAMPLAFGALMVGTPLMVLIAGADFTPSGFVLKLLIWAVVLSFLIATFNYSIIAADKQTALVWPYLMATIFNVVANFIVIPIYSYTGAAITTIVTELIVLIWVGIIAHKTLRLAPSLVVFGKSLLAAVVMAGVIQFMDIENVFINIGVGIMVYGIMVLLLRAVDKDIFNEIISGR